MNKLYLALGHLWTLPWTLVGCLFALGGWTKFHRVDPDWWALHLIAKPGGLYARFFKTFHFCGFTLGAVVVYDDADTAADERVVAHELVHVRQGMINGPFHPIIYGLASLVSWQTRQDVYRGNDYEEQARDEEAKHG